MSRGSRKERKERKRRRPEGAAPHEGAAHSGPGLAQVLASRARSLAGTRWFLPAMLAVLTLGVWARSFAVPVVEWDDDTYLYRDTRLAEVSAANVWRIMTEPYFANYHPVTTLTYAFDRAVYGRWAPGFHATQLAFYLAGVLLLYYLFRAVLGSAPAAFAAAAVYSVHAIHVEPVAWLAQRKDVVCLAFYAGAILAYVRYARESRTPALSPSKAWRFYAAAVALAALAMLSKGYAVVLPGVLVAYDLCFAEGQAPSKVRPALTGVAERFEWRRAWDKLPFVALALAVTAFTLLSQGKDSALTGESLGIGLRVTALFHVFAAYVGRALLPIRLCAKYALSSGNVSLGLAFVGFVLASAFGAGFVLLRRRLPAAAFGLALFVLPLATVMNTFWTLFIWQTDRYLFFPTIGTSLALAAGGVALWRAKSSGPRIRGAIATVASACVILYAALAIERIGVWTDPILLWSDTLRKQMRIGGSGAVSAAELHGIVRRTRRKLNIVDPQALAALAHAYRRAGNEDEAKQLADALTKKGAGESGTDFLLARGEFAAGRYDEAMEILKPMVEGGGWLAPDALTVTGDALAAKGDLKGARESYERALALYVASGRRGTDAVFALANLDYKTRRFGGAAEGYRRVLEAAPENARAKFFLGASLCEIGRAEEGYALYEEALKGALKEARARVKGAPAGSPSLAQIHTMMGKAAQEKLGRPADAVRHFEELLRLVPDHPERAAIEIVIRRQRELMKRGG